MKKKILERHLENVFVDYPELIEPGLVFIQRQIPLHNRKRRIDLQFRDKNGNNLFVELKRRRFKREDVKQVLAYYKQIKCAKDPNTRLMVIATSFCLETQFILRYLGVELKKIQLPLDTTELGIFARLLPVAKKKRLLAMQERTEEGSL